jgi:predicted RNA polymerase sigma factor
VKRLYDCSAHSYEATNWPAILDLYDSLLQIDDSPLVLMNRAIVLSKVKGAGAAVFELEKLATEPCLKNYHLYYSALGSLLIELNRRQEAEKALVRAIRLAPLASERSTIQKMLNRCVENKNS